GAISRALNVIAADDALTPLPSLMAGLARETGDGAQPRPLGGAALGAALGLLILDAIAVFLLAGGLARLGRRAVAGAGAAAAAGLLAVLALAPDARAQGASDAEPADDAFLLHALSELRLAYVLTGDSDRDEMSRAGLEGLSRQLHRRTSIEPGDPIGVRLERDPIALLPMLYWPVARDDEAPSEAAAAQLDQFLKSGGVVVFDTGDAATAASLGAAPHPGLQRILDAVDIPPLAQVRDGHVMTKSFYLLSEFPGRWRDAPVWVEADQRGSARDGVSSVVVTSADWAGAWAIGSDGRPLAAVTPGGERQREMAYRTGINLAMYILTGNYKADQVHVPHLLERLGQ
ncbi:MAG: DUF4159 domain-containing protein, partial [Caulobacterales bacterium]|nr:DUF4159 domain-containing protein [Caulobacterales bacterium]